MRVYYNEHDRFAAAWLRELMRDGLIPEGEVDERDIQTVQPADLAGFDQCHFFAGIGGWAYALELAGWDGPVWTGSCPCQPFSQAGKGKGFADARHLWPAWFRLIRECRPPVVFGEQVGGPDGYHWLDLVSTDLEEAGYAFGAADLAAASVGAPHLRQRLCFVADNADDGRSGVRKARRRWAGPQNDGATGVALGDTLEPGLEGHAGDGAGGFRPPRRVPQPHRPASPAGASGVGLADTYRGRRVEHSQRHGGQEQPGQSAPQRDDAGRCHPWAPVVWLQCNDSKLRPAPPEPALFPLAHGLPNRMGALRGAGNAICAPLAAEFIAAYLEARGQR